MRVGIYGGSFDPVHIGHLLVAESCREQARLDRVLFVPAATPPHKQGRQLAPGVDRLAMLILATGGHPAFEVLGAELDRRFSNRGGHVVVIVLEGKPAYAEPVRERVQLGRRGVAHEMGPPIAAPRPVGLVDEHAHTSVGTSRARSERRDATRPTLST